MIYIKRLLGLPFFAGLLAIATIWNFIVKLYLWVRYGGEAINYNDKMNRKTITDVFLKLEERNTRTLDIWQKWCELDYDEFDSWLRKKMKNNN
jgi:hypothetical protein